MLIGRRRFLRLTGTAAAAVGSAALPGAGPALAAPAGLADLPVHPRADWAGSRAPAAPMPSERDGDVRFLLVHHSVSPNDHAADAVPGLIRGFLDAHTATGWPDVAYNFFVDRFGGIWEGRAGSLERPVIADATGGNQGFSQLVCLIGDFRATPPSARALSSLTRVLAALADRYRIDTAPDARAEFVSRGSNRWPQGTTVTTPTIAGHRDMSRTECPGDACYALIRGPVTEEVRRIRAAAPAAVPVTPGPLPDDDGGGIPTAAVAASAVAVVAAGGAVWAGSRRRWGTLQPPDPATGEPRAHEPESR